jgi:hypothetical protein
MKYVSICILSLCFLGNSLAQATILFPEEHIDFSLDSQYFSINGIYTFQNNSDKTVNHTIYFPFACSVSEVDSIRVANISDGRNVTFLKYTQGISFPISISVMDSMDVNIFYRQRRKKTNTYIITSTQTWGNPLKLACYTLTAPLNLEIENFSYQPDSIATSSNHKIYYWKKQNFMPDKDFEINIK